MFSKSKTPPPPVEKSSDEQPKADKPLGDNKQRSDVKQSGTGATSDSGDQARIITDTPNAPKGDSTPLVDGLRPTTEQLGNAATGAPLTPSTGAPPLAADGTSSKVLDPSLLSKDGMLDRLVAEHAELRTPEVHKRAAEAADAKREHGAPPAVADGALPLEERSPHRTLDSDYEDHREVTVKLGAPAEADFISEGAVVSHVNRASGEVTFRVTSESPAFGSVRARQIVKGG